MTREAIDLTQLRSALGERWARVSVVESTGSTNADLMADGDAPDRTLLVAEDQVAGRGRLDRTWWTPPRAGLTFSVLLRPRLPVAVWGWLPLLAGVALHSAVVATTGVAASLKWPNDLLAEPSGLKLAGILAQSRGDRVVIGIGLNVSTTADELALDTASSLMLSGSAEVDRTSLLVAVASRLDALAAQWAAADGDAEQSGLAAAYRAVCSSLGRRVKLTMSNSSELLGQVLGIEPDGRLRLVSDSGEIVVGAGDLTHLRAI